MNVYLSQRIQFTYMINYTYTKIEHFFFKSQYNIQFLIRYFYEIEKLSAQLKNMIILLDFYIALSSFLKVKGNLDSLIHKN